MDNNMREALREKKEWEKKIGVGSRDKLFDILSGQKRSIDEIDYLKSEETHPVAEEPSRPLMTINQSKALEKYPSLIEMLGEDGIGDKVASWMGDKMNSLIVEEVKNNSSSINSYAVECKEEDGFVKQYFQYPDKVGFVKVKGNFRGKEYIHWDEKSGEAKVLMKKSGNDFLNVSQKYEIEFNFVEIE